MKKIILFLLLFTSLLPLFGKEQKINVTFISVAKSDEVFWGALTALGVAASHDLNINLEILYSDRDHIKAIKLLKRVLKRKIKPDYLIVVGEKNIGSRSILLAEKAKVKLFLFGGLTTDEKRLVGEKPLQKCHYWIGERTINDYAAGYNSAKLIIKKATEKKGDNKTLYMLGLAGVYQTSFNLERVRGLKQALKEYPNVTLLQLVPADWFEEKAYQVTDGLLDRYYEGKHIKIDMIWSANSNMALGAIKALKKHHLIAGKDVFINGIDFLPKAIEKLYTNEIETILGGHVAEIAWILVMIHDDFYGIKTEKDSIPSILLPLNKKNGKLYTEHFKKEYFETIDFTQFSKVLNPKRKLYKFSFKCIIEQFSKTHCKNCK